jgi:hypothetical protein
VILSRHARQRAWERSGSLPPMSRLVRVGPSTLRRFSPSSRPTALRRGLRYFASAGLLLVVRGSTVVTVLALAPADLAELLVSAMFSGGGRC